MNDTVPKFAYIFPFVSECCIALRKFFSLSSNLDCLPYTLPRFSSSPGSLGTCFKPFRDAAILSSCLSVSNIILHIRFDFIYFTTEESRTISTYTTHTMVMSTGRFVAQEAMNEATGLNLKLPDSVKQTFN